MSSNTIRLGQHIDVVPSIHQRSPFAAEVRKLFLARQYQAVAVEVPPFLMNAVLQGVKRLPLVSAVVYDYIDSSGKEAWAYLPLDPTDSIIEAVRMAVPERIPVIPVDLDSPMFENRITVLPDEYAVRLCPLKRYYKAVKPFLPQTPPGSLDDERELRMAVSLRQLDREKKRTLFVCGLGHLEGIRRHFESSVEPVEEEAYFCEPRLYSVNHDTLYFILGELPYLAHLYEKARASIDNKAYEETDGIKELLVAARDEYRSEEPRQADAISTQRLQAMLAYTRNLCLVKRRMTPDLYDIVVAAKGVGGSEYTALVVKLAKYYPFLDTTPDLPFIDMGINRARAQDLGAIELRSRLPRAPVEWKTIKLKPPPPPRLKRKWAHLWNPYRGCSWPPEDDKIESFHRHVRGMTRKLLSEDLARVEKFTTSVKDGIDLRETVRNWHKREIYVKELPPARGEVEVVVFVFEDAKDWEQYPWRTTWYAEHGAESTLALYATNYLEEMVGPGIARAKYGGCFLLYPPRPIPDIWKSPMFDHCMTPAERLTVAAMFHSRERFVTYVAWKRPGLRLREAARRLNRHLVFIPLSRFSRDTIQRLRMVHVLNGMEVRSWASFFVRDPWRL